MHLQIFLGENMVSQWVAEEHYQILPIFEIVSLSNQEKICNNTITN